MVEISSNIEEMVNGLVTEIHVNLMATGGVVHEDVLRRGKAVKARIQELIHERAEQETPGTGLADSIFAETFRDDDDEWNATIQSRVAHAIWFEEGTGLFGPRHAFIFPRGKFMMFTPRGSASRVIAYKVKGQEGKHPFRDGLAAFD